MVRQFDCNSFLKPHPWRKHLICPCIITLPSLHMLNINAEIRRHQPARRQVPCSSCGMNMYETLLQHSHVLHKR